MRLHRAIVNALGRARIGIDRRPPAGREAKRSGTR